MWVNHPVLGLGLGSLADFDRGVKQRRKDDRK